MQNIIIIAVIVLILVVGVRSSIKHMKGEGGCCGGGGEIKSKPKTLSEPKIGEKTITIEGMHCNHCKETVERFINRIDGAVAKVDLKKNTVVVSMSRNIDDIELKDAVQRAGFKVLKIETGENLIGTV